jgi:hypothetical protein
LTVSPFKWAVNSRVLKIRFIPVKPKQGNIVFLMARMELVVMAVGPKKLFKYTCRTLSGSVRGSPKLYAKARRKDK